MGKKPELSGSEVLKYHQEKLADSNRHGHSAPPDAVWWGYFARTTWSGTSWHAAHIAAQHDTISCQDCCAAQCSPDTVHVEKAQKWWAQLKLHHMVLRAISDRELFCRIQCQKMICALLENAARWIKVNQGESRWIKVNQGESRWIKVNQGESRWTTIYNRARAFPSASGPKWKALPPSQSAARLGDPLSSFRAHRLNGFERSLLGGIENLKWNMRWFLTFNIAAQSDQLQIKQAWSAVEVVRFCWRRLERDFAASEETGFVITLDTCPLPLHFILKFPLRDLRVLEMHVWMGGCT